jgi:hypothetical protein
MFLAHTYFTSFPYDIYNEANSHGNMAYAGIGLGLIKAQQLFWIANACLLAMCFNQNLFIILAPFCCYMYFLSLTQALYLQKMIHI